jgi:glutamate synthase (NADPH/NADH)
MVMASEIGVYDVEPGDVVQKGRLRPGRMLLVDTESKTIMRDEELKRSIAEARPHGKWWREHLTLRDFVRNIFYSFFSVNFDNEISSETF